MLDYIRFLSGYHCPGESCLNGFRFVRIGLLQEDISTIDITDDDDDETEKTETPTEVEVEPLYSCDKCAFDSENADDLRKHKKKNIHSDKDKSFQEIKDELLEDNFPEIELPEEIYICGECSERFETYVDCEQHTKSHDAKSFKCDFKSTDKKKLESHERIEHELLKCSKQSHTGKCKTSQQTK